MARRSLSLGGLRPLALAVVVATSLLAPVGISAQAAEDDAAPTETAPGGDPAVPAPAPDPDGTAPSPAPVASQPPAPSTVASPPSSPPPTAVEVSRASASASKSVSIVDFAFNPGSITVNSGDTVQWTNNGKVPEGHDVTGDGLDSGLLNPGDSYSHTFNAAGTFSYVCTIHPAMTGAVEVLDRSSTGSGGSNGGSGGASGEASPGAAPTESSGTAGTGSGAGSLPTSGSDSSRLAMLGLMLVGLGLALRVLRPRGAEHRQG